MLRQSINNCHILDFWLGCFRCWKFTLRIFSAIWTIVINMFQILQWETHQRSPLCHQLQAWKNKHARKKRHNIEHDNTPLKIYEVFLHIQHGSKHYSHHNKPDSIRKATWFTQVSSSSRTATGYIKNWEAWLRN